MRAVPYFSLFFIFLLLFSFQHFPLPPPSSPGGDVQIGIHVFPFASSSPSSPVAYVTVSYTLNVVSRTLAPIVFGNFSSYSIPLGASVTLQEVVAQGYSGEILPGGFSGAGNSSYGSVYRFIASPSNSSIYAFFNYGPISAQQIQGNYVAFSVSGSPGYAYSVLVRGYYVPSYSAFTFTYNASGTQSFLFINGSTQVQYVEVFSYYSRISGFIVGEFPSDDSPSAPHNTGSWSYVSGGVLNISPSFSSAYYILPLLSSAGAGSSIRGYIMGVLGIIALLANSLALIVGVAIVFDIMTAENEDQRRDAYRRVQVLIVFVAVMDITLGYAALRVIA